MTNYRTIFTAITISAFALISCSDEPQPDTTSGSNSNSSIVELEKDPYEMMHVAFEDSPEIDKIKPLIEAVMDNYTLPKTNENKLKVGSMLVSLRKASAVGVTEMEILKHIYQHGSNQISLPDQAAISMNYLETNK